MPQPKSSRGTSSSRKSSSSRSSSSKASGAGRSTARKAPAKKSSGASRSTARKTPAKKASGASRSTAKKSPATRAAAKPSGASRTTAQRSTAKRAPARKRAPAKAAASRTTATSKANEDAVRQQLNHAREVLERAVVLTRDRIQEAMDDAVERGRMTRDDAEQLVQDLIKIGRKQTEEVRSDIEQLIGKGADVAAIGDAGKTARKRVSSAAKTAARTPIADRARREVDRARRAAGVGPTFPILGYDDLTAGQVTSSLDDLTPAELRKVRDYERRHANRKSVLNAVEKKLA
jgi:polyhydroxyalkanoate synthesis regulator phasin